MKRLSVTIRKTFFPVLLFAYFLASHAHGRRVDCSEDLKGSTSASERAWDSDQFGNVASPMPGDLFLVSAFRWGLSLEKLAKLSISDLWESMPEYLHGSVVEYAGATSPFRSFGLVLKVPGKNYFTISSRDIGLTHSQKSIQERKNFFRTMSVFLTPRQLVGITYSPGGSLSKDIIFNEVVFEVKDVEVIGFFAREEYYVPYSGVNRSDKDNYNLKHLRKIAENLGVPLLIFPSPVTKRVILKSQNGWKAYSMLNIPGDRIEKIYLEKWSEGESKGTLYEANFKDKKIRKLTFYSTDEDPVVKRLLIDLQIATGPVEEVEFEEFLNQYQTSVLNADLEDIRTNWSASLP